ncbi:TauD/TfdA family dioxygenase [Bordetella sp. BOR01]|uniref:TauD/TfdA dioxygenase family protein n=1 Tax=Bordetella sp. BOR01 TaxID=2854779 RepID=UPI001C493CDD|nr:TauD/TfdA family dioxygenase [Bordetella sp. BOR01]MBV7484091.1 TauD/TfdA family dioxygenase [Bordetella sp. BOR01]
MVSNEDVYRYEASGITVKKLADHVGAEVDGVDLSIPVSAEVARDIKDAWERHGVVVFRNQDLPPTAHRDFSAHFGPLVGHVLSRFNMADCPEVTIISNVVDEKGEKIGADRAGMLWHSDMSFVKRPSMGSLLYCVECPPVGADTQFASMHAAYDALPPEEQQRLATRQGVHDYAWHYRTYLAHRAQLTAEEEARTPPVTHPVIRTHPGTGRQALYVGEGLTRTIAGMDEDAGRKLVVELSDFATQPQFVYSHKWRPGDLVFWDNRSTMHRATEFDDRYRRLMRRTTILGDEPFYRAA